MWPQERSRQCRRRNPRPAWWLLYVIAVGLVVVVGLVDTLVPGGGLRKIVESLTTVSGFGLIGVWLRRNRIALELEQARRRT
jgi:hypothetical protein